LGPAKIDETTATIRRLRDVKFEAGPDTILSNEVAEFKAMREDPFHLDPYTGIPAVEETILVEAADPAVRDGFRIRPGSYAAPTLANLFEMIARDNDCLMVRLSEGRKRIVVTISDRVTACPGAGQGWYQCRSRACDPR
jgi:hypothetical protein